MSGRRKSTLCGVLDREECREEQLGGPANPVAGLSSRPRVRAPRRHSVPAPQTSFLTNESSSDDDNRKSSTSPLESAAKRMKLLACDEVTEEPEEHDTEGMEGELGEERLSGAESSIAEIEDREEEEDEEEEMIVEKTTIESPEGSDDFEQFDHYEEEEMLDDSVSTAKIEGTHMIDGPSDIHERMRQFRHLSHVLESNYEIKPLSEPPQLTRRCHGVGKASEVWSLLCYKDDVHSVKKKHFLQPHRVTSKNRSTLVDWMMEVCNTEKLHRETFHLAVDYLDRFLSRAPEYGIFAAASNFQLLGTTAIFIASKYEEIYPPKLEEIVMYTDGACTSSQVQQLELQVLKVLEWELNVVTGLHWLHLFLQLMGDKETEVTECEKKRSTPPQTQLSIDEHYTEEGVEDDDSSPATVPTCRREEFLHLVQMLDVAVLMDGCRQFSNRTLASAVLFAAYEPASFVEEITGLSCREREVAAAIEFVEPIVLMCEQHRPLGDPFPIYEAIRPDASHNIQSMRGIEDDNGVDGLLERVENVRKRLGDDRRRRSSHSLHTRGAAIRLRV